MLPLATVSLGIDVGTGTTSNPHAAVLRRVGEHTVLSDALFSPPHPCERDPHRITFDDFAWVDQGASDLLNPWTNFDRSEPMIRCWAWRKDREIQALSIGLAPASVPQRIDLGAVPARVVRPALRPSPAEVNVFAFTAGSRELVCAKFKTDAEAKPLSQEIAWRMPLPPNAVTARAGLSFPERSLRRVALISKENRGLLVHCIDADFPPAQVEPAKAILLEGASALTNSEPAVRVEANGETRVSLLVTGSDSPLAYAIADCRFTAEGLPADRPILTPLGELPAPTLCATVAFSFEPAWPLRREWLAMLIDGRIVHSPGQGQPRFPKAAFTFPPELFLQGGKTYVLTNDPVSGPMLLPLI